MKSLASSLGMFIIQSFDGVKKMQSIPISYIHLENATKKDYY
ncbi:hypothetical protein KP78_38410 [Jeotgalibacillus soli]|uniref:Uncharacterized protein n=1 Tax=Jeotgalibacillus soli TaxID=889306 RepID=A0A0C2VF37_9BACL|nr:hypothetical protein KP78_38410 [Jeotgalibacillus soli]